MDFYKEKFINIRKSQNLTQDDIAKKLNITQGSVMKWEKGLNIPRVSKVIQLANALHCDVSDISNLDTYYDENKKQVVTREINRLTSKADLMSKSATGGFCEVENTYKGLINEISRILNTDASDADKIVTIKVLIKTREKN